MSTNLLIYLGPLLKIKKELSNLNTFLDITLNDRFFLNYNNGINENSQYVYLGPNHTIPIGRHPFFTITDELVFEFDKIDQANEINIFITEYKTELKVLEDAFGQGSIEVCWGISS